MTMEGGWSWSQNRRASIVSLCVAGVTLVAHLIWLCLNIFIIILNHQQLGDGSLVKLQLVYQSLGFVSILVGEANLSCYPGSIIVISMVQLLFGCYLLWGVLQRSEGKLKVWLIYEGLVMGVGLLYFFQVLSRPSTNTTDDVESESDGMFWMHYIGRVVLFLCFNGLYIYSINYFRDEIIDASIAFPLSVQTEFIDFDRSSAGTSSTYSKEMWVVFIALLNFTYYGSKVLIASIYILWLALNDTIAKFSALDSTVYLVIGVLGLGFTYNLWQGNKTGNNGKLIIYMGYHIITSALLYGWLIYWTVTGLAFDFVVLKFTLIFFIAFISIHTVSKRTHEIGYEDKYQRIHHPDDHDHGQEHDMVQLMDLSTTDN